MLGDNSPGSLRTVCAPERRETEPAELLGADLPAISDKASSSLSNPQTSEISMYGRLLIRTRPREIGHKRARAYKTNYQN